MSVPTAIPPHATHTVPAPDPVRLKPPEPGPFSDPPAGPLVAPGRYTVSLAKRVGGVLTPLGRPQSFETLPLGTAKLSAADRDRLREELRADALRALARLRLLKAPEREPEREIETACAGCGGAVDREARFCSHCGARL